LPKFEDDLYVCGDEQLLWIPTAKCRSPTCTQKSLADGLPPALVAQTLRFRREAGAAEGTRGLLRVHQFDKVELVRFCRPEESDREHELLTGHAEAVLRRLELPYRVVELATGDTGFSAARTYDLEVWAAGVGAWLECSSSSTFTDFQARRANIRFRPRRAPSQS
jgi:seryl-tRNA synthetase